MKFTFNSRLLFAVALCAVALCLHFAAGVDLAALASANPDATLGLAALAMAGEVKATGNGATIEEIKGVIVEKLGELTKETRDHMSRQATDLLELQQKMDKRSRLGTSGDGMDLAGAGAAEITRLLTGDPQFKGMQDGLVKSLRISVGLDTVRPMEAKTAILSQSPLLQPERVGVFGAPPRPLRVRDVLSTIPTAASAIEFAQFTKTNNAAVQYDSPNYDGALKPESAMSFTLVNRPVRTIAHWIPASVQVLDDAPSLQALIENELLFGLSDKEDDELMLGDGTGGHLDGLLHNATSFNRVTTGGTMADTIRRSITQVNLANGRANAIIIHPADAEALDLIKTTTGEYLQVVAGGRTWTVAVVETQAITEGQFLTGDFARAARLHVRQEATVELSRAHADFFVRNLVAILVEERVVLGVYRPSMLVKGSF